MTACGIANAARRQNACGLLAIRVDALTVSLKRLQHRLNERWHLDCGLPAASSTWAEDRVGARMVESWGPGPYPTYPDAAAALSAWVNDYRSGTSDRALPMWAARCIRRAASVV